MAQVFPFQGVLPPPEVAAQVATPPYDVMSRDEAKAMAEGNPDSFLRVTRAEIDLPDRVSAYDEDVYRKARENYLSLKRKGVLVKDRKQSFYIYRLVMDGRSQTGVVVAASVDDYDRDIIRKHERTRPAKEDDRTRHILAVEAHTGPVFLTCRSNPRINELIAMAVAELPHCKFVARDGVEHTLWRVPEAATEHMQRAFDGIDYLYIADGHHRAASASRARAVRRDQNDSHQGHEPYNRFLAVVFPADQLLILPYNRVVADLNGLGSDEFLARVRQVAGVEAEAAATPAAGGTCSMYLQGVWYKLTFCKSPGKKSVVESLDANLLQNFILGPILGIDDPRTSDRIDFVGGIRGTEELERRVDSGEMSVAFSMYPTTVEELMAVSDADQIMPPKSTWFEPKLRDAVVVHEI